MTSTILSRMAEVEAAGGRAVAVTVVRATGSTPRAPGARMLVFADGSIEGTIGGGRIEAQAITEALEVLASERPRFTEHALTQELGMCCGGSVALFFEPLGGQPRLIIFGAGHVGTALTRMAAHAGFVVHVADERDELLHESRLAEARALHPDLDDPALPFGPEAFVMITTHDHALDQRLVERCLRRPFRWLGLIGSRRKAALTRQRLETMGFAPEAIQRVRSPVGLAIAAETPEEIAVSILGELIAVRRGASIGGPDATMPRLETKPSAEGA
jgi:xanthine dehydrogenase accessory factor